MKKKFIKDGFILIKNFFSKKEIKKVKKDIEKVFESYNKKSDDLSIMKLFENDFKGFHGCAKACQNLISLNELSTSKKMIVLLKKLGLNFPSINTRPLISFSSKHTSKKEIYWRVPAHQDWPSVQGSLNGVTCWVPLVEMKENLGFLEIAKGSHKRGYIHHDVDGVPFLSEEQVSNEVFTPIKMKMRDILIFNCFTIHRSGINATDNQIRLTTHFRYNDLSEKTFIKRKLPHQRIDIFDEKILFPNFPNKKEIKYFFKSQK